MGNYYKNRRPFGKCRNGSRRGFIGGGMLLLMVALLSFSSLGDPIKEAAAQGTERLTALFQQAVAWGKGQGRAGTSLAVPVNSVVVVEEFGVVTDVDGKEAYHKGIDIRVPAGSEVLAAADGKVSDVAEHEDGTLWITVAHEQNWSTVYGRLGEASVASGDEVKQGDALGTPANEILHFEVLEGENEKDPVGYFQTETDG